MPSLIQICVFGTYRYHAWWRSIDGYVDFLIVYDYFLQDGVTPLSSLATFGTYVAIHGGAALTPSLAFTLLALFSILVRIFSIAPLGVQYVSEAIIAMQRLQQLLDLPNGHGLDSSNEKSEVIISWNHSLVIKFVLFVCSDFV